MYKIYIEGLEVDHANSKKNKKLLMKIQKKFNFLSKYHIHIKISVLVIGQHPPRQKINDPFIYK